MVTEFTSFLLSCYGFFSLMSLNISGIINFDIIPYNDNYLLVMLWPYLFLFLLKQFMTIKNIGYYSHYFVG